MAVDPALAPDPTDNEILCMQKMNALLFSISGETNTDLASVPTDTGMDAMKKGNQLLYNRAVRGTPAGGGINYSYNEQDTGLTWVDGSKVYQKTVEVGPLPNNDWAATPHGIINIATMVDLRGTATAPSLPEYFIILPHMDIVSTTNSVEVYADGTNIMVRAEDDRTMYTEAHVTMLYTCTDR